MTKLSEPLIYLILLITLIAFDLRDWVVSGSSKEWTGVPTAHKGLMLSPPLATSSFLAYPKKEPKKTSPKYRSPL